MESINHSISSPRQVCWGVDIGGTAAKIGCLSDSGFALVDTIPTGPQCRPDALLTQISRVIRMHESEPLAVGIGVAGLVADGVVVSSPNLPLWGGADLKNLPGVDAPVFVDNDCNVFAAGALSKGSIPEAGLWLFVTFGTGIGGTIINDGRILYGTGYAGEFGHTTVKEGGLPCPCGSNGCWERYAGAEALEWYYKRLAGNSISPVELARLADMGEERALEAFREFGRWVGIGLANLAKIFSPYGFFAGGGLSAASRHFLPTAALEYTRRCDCPWSFSVLDDSPLAGALGAASVAQQFLC